MMVVVVMMMIAMKNMMISLIGGDGDVLQWLWRLSAVTEMIIHDGLIYKPLRVSTTSLPFLSSLNLAN